jgi:hypothetical protein
VGIAVGTLVGTAFASPVLGLVIGAGLATPLGILEETGIADGIDDPRLRGEIEEATIGRYIYRTMRNMLAPRVAGKFAQLVSAGLGPWINRQLAGLVAWLARNGSKLLAEVSLYTTLKR